MFGDKKGRNGIDEPFKIFHTECTGKAETVLWAGSGMWPSVIHGSRSSSSMLVSRCFNYSPVLTAFRPLPVSRRAVTYNRRSRSVRRREMNQQGGK